MRCMSPHPRVTAMRQREAAPGWGARAAGCLLLCAFASAGASGAAPPVLCATAGDDRVESPDARWKTIATQHYRIHYPANPKGGFLPFASEVASKIEGISAKVAELVGFEAKGPIDVIIQDPLMEANGATIPLLRQPVVLLYKTPPEPDSQLGNYENWVDLLVTHELVHLHHLMRPQNKGRLFDRLAPAGPLTLKLLTSRYMTEGYATMLEGRVTGSGRPHSAYRAAVIRQWAIQGKLPDYGNVSGAEGYLGGSMAYLVGSAYLEWLERQFPDEPDILVTLWKQLASKKRRDFEKSFKATFGVSPADSYDRWRAEVTHDAIAMEQAVKKGGGALEGEVFGRFDGSVTDLAVSPDGAKLLARVLSKKKPGVKIWDLTGKEKEKEEGGRKGRKAKGKGKEEEEGPPDPLEPADRKPEFEERKPMATIARRNGALPRRAWWTGDDQVTFELRLPDSEDVLKPSFRTLDLKTKRERRAPSGTAAPDAADGAFARKDIGGVWNIVRRSPDGSETQVTNTLSAAWQPAPTPDGMTLYYVRLTATGCEIRKLDLTAGAAPQDLQAADAAPREPQAAGAATQAPQAAGAATQAPQAAGAATQAPQAAGAGLGADGAQGRPEAQGELHAADARAAQAADTAPLAPQAAGATPRAPQPIDVQALQDAMLTKGAVLSLPNAASLLPPPLAEIPEAKDYSVWDTHKSGLLEGVTRGPSGYSIQLGIGGSDVLDRMRWVAAASAGSAAGPRGAALGVGYAGWRVSPALQAFSSLEKPSAQDFAPVYGFDRERRGAELTFMWDRGGLASARVCPFVAFETIEKQGRGWEGAQDKQDADRYMGGALASFYTHRSRGDWGVGLFASFHGAFGRTEYWDGPIVGAPGDPKGTDWRLFRLAGRLRLQTPAGVLGLGAQEGRLDGGFGDFDLFHLGGHAPLIVPRGLEINRVQQPALPSYTQTGDRMRVLRATYGLMFQAYFERSAVWSSGGDGPDHLRVAGLEMSVADSLGTMGALAPDEIRIGVHRPYDGAMKGRTVFTMKVSLRM